MRNLIIKINAILMLGILIIGVGTINSMKENINYICEESVKKNNEKEIKNNILLSSNDKDNKSNEGLMPDDIPVKKLEDVVVGPETRKKLNMEPLTPKEESHHVENKILSRGGSVGEEITLNITFYTDSDEENGGYGGMVSNNKKIAPGMVASPEEYGTKFYIPSFGKEIEGLEGIKVFTVEDKMHSKEEKKAPNRVDIYVPRLPGEEDYSYSRRVNNYGRYSVKAYKYK